MGKSSSRHGLALIVLVAALLLSSCGRATAGHAAPTYPASETSTTPSVLSTPAYLASGPRLTAPLRPTSPNPASGTRTTPPIQPTCAYGSVATPALDATPSAAVARTGTLAVSLQRTPPSVGPRTISLIALDGQTVSTVQANAHSPVSCDDPANQIAAGSFSRVGVNLPFTSASADRVYFLDGDVEVRWLGRDDRSGHAVTIPGGPSKIAVISVSPDDLRIAVGLFDYSTWPVHETIYVQDLSGANRVQLQSLSGEYYWPVAWHAGALVLEQPGRDDGFIGSYTYGIDSARGLAADYRLLDPATGALGPALAPAGCRLSGSLPSAAGFVCGTTDDQVVGVSWSGTATTFMPGTFTGGGALSPDGSLVAACCYDGAVIKIGSPTVAPRYTAASGYVDEGGWLDATHLAFRVAGTADIAILDTSTNTVVRPDSLRESMICDRVPASG